MSYRTDRLNRDLLARNWEDGVTDLMVILAGILIGYVCSDFTKIARGLHDPAVPKRLADLLAYSASLMLAINTFRLVHGLIIVRRDPYYRLKVAPVLCEVGGACYRVCAWISSILVLLFPYIALQGIAHLEISKEYGNPLQLSEKAPCILFLFALMLGPYVFWDFFDSLMLKHKGKFNVEHIGVYHTYLKIWCISDLILIGLSLVVSLIIFLLGQVSNMKICHLGWQVIVYGSIYIISFVYLIAHYYYNNSFYFNGDVRLKELVKDP